MFTLNIMGPPGAIKIYLFIIVIHLVDRTENNERCFTLKLLFTEEILSWPFGALLPPSRN